MKVSFRDRDGRFRLTPRRIARRLQHVSVRLMARLTAARLALRNRCSTASILGEAEAVVCLTSHGNRLDRVHLAIESVGRGRLRPRRLILWLDGQVEDHQLPQALRRFARTDEESAERILTTVEILVRTTLGQFVESADRRRQCGRVGTGNLRQAGRAPDLYAEFLWHLAL